MFQAVSGISLRQTDNNRGQCVGRVVRVGWVEWVLVLLVLAVKIRVCKDVISSRNREEDMPGDGVCLSKWRTNELLTLDQ